MDDYVCRVCAVENGIKMQVGGWQAIGPCPVCGERHALFAPVDHSELRAIIAKVASDGDGAGAERSEGDE
jgi:hypothetical protein